MISMKAWVFRFLIQEKMPNVVNNAARRELKNVLDMVSVEKGGFPFCLVRCVRTNN